MLTTYQVLHSTSEHDYENNSTTQTLKAARSRLPGSRYLVLLGRKANNFCDLSWPKYRSWRVFFTWSQYVPVFGSKWNRYTCFWLNKARVGKHDAFPLITLET